MIGKLASVGSRARAVTPGPPSPFPVGQPPTALRHADLNNDSSSRAINDYCKLPIRCPRLLLALGLRIIPSAVDRLDRSASLSRAFGSAPRSLCLRRVVKISLNSESDLINFVLSCVDLEATRDLISDLYKRPLQAIYFVTLQFACVARALLL